MPMTGVMPMHMPMFSNVWNVKNAATPKHTSEPMLLPERMPTMTQRMMMISSSTMTRMQAIMPSSSPMTA